MRLILETSGTFNIQRNWMYVSIIVFNHSWVCDLVNNWKLRQISIFLHYHNEIWTLYDYHYFGESSDWLWIIHFLRMKKVSAALLPSHLQNFKVIVYKCIPRVHHWNFFDNTLSEFHGLVQERLNSIANALGLHLSCINPARYWTWPVDAHCEALLDQDISNSAEKKRKEIFQNDSI